MVKRKGVLKKAVTEKGKRKEKAPYDFKSLNKSIREKALLAAEAHVYKLNNENIKNETILLQLSTKSPTCKSKEFTRRMVSIPNRLRSLKDTSILLVTRDPVDTFRISLTEKTAVTANTFTEIVGFKKFKGMVGTSKKALKTYHEYDLVIVDGSLHKFLPKLLEPTIFCKSSQNFPLMLQLTKPATGIKLTTDKKANIDLDYIQAQVRAWCKNTTFVPSTGPSISIVVGLPGMSGSAIVENIDSVIAFLTNINNRPVGGIISDGLNGISDIHLRANDKTLPILKKGEQL